jgi:hypothetical protein
MSSLWRMRTSQNQLAHLHALGSDQAIGQQSNFAGPTSQQNHFQASTMIEVDVCCGNDLLQMIVLKFGQTIANLTSMVVVDQGNHAHGRFIIRCNGLGNQSGSHQSTHSLTAIRIPMLVAVVVKPLQKLATNGHTESDQWLFAGFS